MAIPSVPDAFTHYDAANSASLAVYNRYSHLQGIPFP
jgi:hypothetical protein